MFVTKIIHSATELFIKIIISYQLSTLLFYKHNYFAFNMKFTIKKLTTIEDKNTNGVVWSKFPVKTSPVASKVDAYKK